MIHQARRSGAGLRGARGASGTGDKGAGIARSTTGPYSARGGSSFRSLAQAPHSPAGRVAGADASAVGVASAGGTAGAWVGTGMAPVGGSAPVSTGASTRGPASAGEPPAISPATPAAAIPAPATTPAIPTPAPPPSEPAELLGSESVWVGECASGGGADGNSVTGRPASRWMSCRAEPTAFASAGRPSGVFDRPAASRRSSEAGTSARPVDGAGWFITWLINA